MDVPSTVGYRIEHDNGVLNVYFQVGDSEELAAVLIPHGFTWTVMSNHGDQISQEPREAATAKASSYLADIVEYTLKELFSMHMGINN